MEIRILSIIQKKRYVGKKREERAKHFKGCVLKKVLKMRKKISENCKNGNK